MTGQAEATRGARVIYIPPPLYYGAGFAAGMLLDSLVGFPWAGVRRPRSPGWSSA